jgi:hypothetical protein
VRGGGRERGGREGREVKKPPSPPPPPFFSNPSTHTPHPHTQTHPPTLNCSPYTARLNSQTHTRTSCQTKSQNWELEPCNLRASTCYDRAPLQTPEEGSAVILFPRIQLRRASRLLT